MHYRYRDPASKSDVWAAQGEDIIELNVDPKDGHRAAVTLRGGYVIKDVPLEYVYDPDGKSWEYRYVSVCVDLMCFFFCVT